MFVAVMCFAQPATPQGFLGFGQPRPAGPPAGQPDAPLSLIPPAPLSDLLVPLDQADAPLPLPGLPVLPDPSSLPEAEGIATETLAPPPPTEPVPVAPAVILASEAHVRWLDKLTGRTADLWLAPGTLLRRDHLSIRMDECRVPEAAPASDAFAYLVIHDTRVDQRLFAGWMIASSPALSAMDHPRYDVWLMGCATEAGSGQ